MREHGRRSFLLHLMAAIGAFLVGLVPGRRPWWRGCDLKSRNSASIRPDGRIQYDREGVVASRRGRLRRVVPGDVIPVVPRGMNREQVRWSVDRHGRRYEWWTVDVETEPGSMRSP